MSNIIKFQLQSQFERFFMKNFVCDLTNERYKTYQMRFSFCRLGHALGVGLGVLRGPKLNSVRGADRMLSPPKPFDHIQPNLVCVCVCYSHAWGMQHQKNFGPAPWGGVKRTNEL